MASLALPLQHYSLRTVLRLRRAAGRDWLEAALPLGTGGMQNFPRRLPRRPAEAFSARSNPRHGRRALLSRAGGAYPSRVAPRGLGLAGSARPEGSTGGAPQPAPGPAQQ